VCVCVCVFVYVLDDISTYTAVRKFFTAGNVRYF